MNKKAEYTMLLHRYGVKSLKCAGGCGKPIEKKQPMAVWFREGKATYWCLPCWQKKGRN